MTGTQHHPHRLSTTHKFLLWIFFLGLFVPGGVGFIQKLILFIKSFHDSQEGGFTILPVLTYLIVAAGMMLLFFWAVSHGMFRNIEEPKFTQLDLERQLDEEEGILWEHHHD